MNHLPRLIFKDCAKALLVFVYFLSQKQGLRPLCYYAPPASVQVICMIDAQSGLNLIFLLFSSDGLPAGFEPPLSRRRAPAASQRVPRALKNRLPRCSGELAMSTNKRAVLV